MSDNSHFTAYLHECAERLMVPPWIFTGQKEGGDRLELYITMFVSVGTPELVMGFGILPSELRLCES